MTYASPALSSISVPSSCVTVSVPDPTTPTWRSWQLSVPATGFTHSDHFQPGSKVRRAAAVSPTCTTSTRVLSGVLVSSGESKSNVWMPAISASLLVAGRPILFPSAGRAQGGGLAPRLARGDRLHLALEPLRPLQRALELRRFAAERREHALGPGVELRRALRQCLGARKRALLVHEVGAVGRAQRL